MHNPATLAVKSGTASSWRERQNGKIGYILLWAIGVPIPLLFLIYLLRGCN